ncbi:MAG TPA: hypothetical protein VF345_14250, partial [Chthoniobacterales bacterium]
TRRDATARDLTPKLVVFVGKTANFAVRSANFAARAPTLAYIVAPSWLLEAKDDVLAEAAQL